MTIRPATADDHAAIALVVSAAFGRSDEATLVEGVRAAGEAMAELVAETGGEIVGHVLFSRMKCEPAMLVAGLGPLAVTPAHQGAGTGSSLARAGLAACREMGARACVVLGAPAYYGRFGFAADASVRSRFSALPAFQALALQAGALYRPIEVAYPAAFD